MSVELDDISENSPLYEERKNSWTWTGIECLQSNADCSRCTTGLNKDNVGDGKCHQPEANKRLLELGVPIPEITSFYDRASGETKVGLKKKHKVHVNESMGRKVRAEVVKYFIAQKEAELPALCKHLNAIQFGDIEWNEVNIYGHIFKLRKGGVLEVKRKKNRSRECRHALYALVDASRLPMVDFPRTRHKRSQKEE